MRERASGTQLHKSMLLQILICYLLRSGFVDYKMQHNEKVKEVKHSRNAAQVEVTRLSKLYKKSEKTCETLLEKASEDHNQKAFAEVLKHKAKKETDLHIELTKKEHDMNMKMERTKQSSGLFNLTSFSNGMLGSNVSYIYFALLFDSITHLVIFYSYYFLEQ